MDEMYAVELLGVSKTFGTLWANRDITLRVKKGEIHAIVGENGAGKTTLMNILYGILQPSSGEVRVNGKKLVISSPKVAIAHGIGMIHQHFMLVPSFTVAENICLGYEPVKGSGFVDKKAMTDKARALSDAYSLKVDPQVVVEDLSVGLLQRVEILKALSRGAEILILDEPTAVLTPLECEELFKILRAMAAGGKTVLLITHKLKEVMAVSDSVTVLSHGMTQGTIETHQTSIRDLAGRMMGRDVESDDFLRTAVQEGEVVFRLENLKIFDSLGVERVRDVSLEVHRGEILTVAGVEGNGQSELINGIIGMNRIHAGRVLAKGEDITHSPIAKRRQYMGIIPEDRISTGLSLQASVHDNLIGGYHRSGIVNKGMWLDFAASRALADKLIQKYDIVAENQNVSARNLSGGNQQKVVLARETFMNHDILIVSQPSRGVDIGATRFIHEQLIALRNAGTAILLVSTDLDEVFALSDRIVTIFGGEIVGEFVPSGITREEIGMYMTGSMRAAAKEEQAVAQ